MSVRKILWFIVACLLLLGAVCWLFPRDGVQVGPVHLRFASPLSLTGGQDTVAVEPQLSPEQQLSRMAEAFRLRQLSELADSLDYYRHFFEESPVGIQFPGADPSLLDGFFAQMETARGQGGTLHVMHYGDSQIEQDRITASLREMWQSRFGGMGPGLIPAVQVIPTATLSQEAWGGWQRHAIYGPREMNVEHHRYGPMGQFCELEDSAFVDISPRGGSRGTLVRQFSRVRLLMGCNQAGFRATLYQDDQAYTQVVGDSSSVLRVLDWSFSRPVRSLSMSFRGRAEIYGLILEGPDGVSVDNIPMRGCSGTIFTQMDAALLRQAYQAMNVRLFVLEFGGNRMTVIKTEEDARHYAAVVGRQIRYLKKLRPEAEILFIGPADMSCMVEGEMASYPMLETTIAALREVCLENGAAFWDMYRVMGGRNSMLAWVKTQPPMAASDYIHFTFKGSQRISQLLCESLSLCYDYYCFRRARLSDSTLLQIGQLDRSRDYARDFSDMLRESAADSLWVDDTDEEALYEALKKQMQSNLHQEQQP